MAMTLCSLLILLLMSVSCAQEPAPGLSTGPEPMPKTLDLVELWSSGTDPIPPQRLTEGSTRYPVNLSSYHPGDDFLFRAQFNGLEADTVLLARVEMRFDDLDMLCSDEGPAVEWKGDRIFSPRWKCRRTDVDERVPVPAAGLPTGTLRVEFEMDPSERVAKELEIVLCPIGMLPDEVSSGTACDIRGP